METDLGKIARREKVWAALSSVLAAVLLTVMKLVIGLMTNSLGILAEAAHSGLDLVAAIVTLFAVRISDRPADREHHYGHGKVENISALFETLLLLITCVWIIYEAVQRLFYRPADVDPSAWAFLTMGISIVVDISRSRMLYRVARKYNSQALEADGLHFSTDVWSSSVVILGLLGVVLANQFPALGFLRQADAMAALLVAAIVVYVSLQLGKRTVMALVDTAPRGVGDQIRQIVEAVPGVKNCHDVRVRYAGAHSFADIHVLVEGGLDLNAVHAITETIEKAIHQQLPTVDLIVHPEPDAPPFHPQGAQSDPVSLPEPPSSSKEG